MLLRAVRPLVPIVGGGLLLFASDAGAGGLARRTSSTLPYDSGWLQAAYVLILWLGVAGAVAGTLDRKTRELAEHEAEGDLASAELARRLREPLALTLDASMLVATVAIVALMVWKP